MKLEDLKNARIVFNSPGANTTALSWAVRAGVHIWHGPNDIFTPQTALLAAARFRASHEVVESGKNLLAAFEDFHISVEDYPWMSEAFERFRAALALADNTNETP